MKTDVWMPIYIGDYLADTTRLNTMQHGAYLLLIMDYWRNGPPPDDDVILAQITKCLEHDWSIARSVLAQFFTIEGGVWRHKRIDAELSEAREKKSAAQSKAKTAAQARWNAPRNAPSDAPSIAPSTPQAMHASCPSPSPSPISSKTTPLSPRGDRAEFDHFWSAWPAGPRKVGKIACEKKWVARGLNANSQRIIDHVTAMARTEQWRDYCPAPLTYLNQSRWEDGLPTTATTASTRKID